jgi:diphthine synthase
MINKEKLVRLSGNSSTISKTIQEEFYGRDLIIADRDMVETESDAILAGADKLDVALLVVGDPFG